jgi:uncharacterized metal-binding protein YceD (DUF177 family)
MNARETSGAAPEFSRPVNLRRLSRSTAHEIDERADETECARLARLLDLLALSKVRIHGTLSPSGDAGWRFDGTVGATVTQACVVTLEPVRTRIDVAVARNYLPSANQTEALAEIEVDAEALEEVDPLPEVLDLGLLAIEELALALPAYPRAPGVEDTALIMRTDDGEDEPPRKPFAALAALREKMREEDE